MFQKCSIAVFTLTISETRQDAFSKNKFPVAPVS